ncbi:MAG: hypothetical protein ACLPSW_22540 [Roseiarcus sp.]
MAKDPNVHYRNLVAGYTEAIRNTDAKAFIGVLFIAIMMATVLGYRDNYPSYLNPPILVIPFLFIFFNLLVCVFPRFPRAGRERFPILRNPEPDDFLIILDEERELAELPLRCAMLSRILYWKTVTLQISYFTALVLIFAAAILLFVARIWPTGH